MSQPKPIPNENPHIVDRLIVKLLERKQVGIERYGVTLQAFNGRNSLQDLAEELQDASIYVLQALEEKEVLMEAIANLLYTHDNPDSESPSDFFDAIENLRVVYQKLLVEK